MELTRICSPSPPVTKQFLDLVFYRGTTFRATFTFKDSQNNPLSLTGIEVKFHLLEIKGDEQLIILSSTSSPNTNNSSIIIPTPSNGKANIVFSDEETSLIEFDNARWWLTLTLPNGDVLSRGKGKVEIKEPYE